MGFHGLELITKGTYLRDRQRIESCAGKVDICDGGMHVNMRYMRQ